jgi:hypothetical protein
MAKKGKAAPITAEALGERHLYRGANLLLNLLGAYKQTQEDPDMFRLYYRHAPSEPEYGIYNTNYTEQRADLAASLYLAEVNFQINCERPPDQSNAAVYAHLAALISGHISEIGDRPSSVT